MYVMYVRRTILQTPRASSRYYSDISCVCVGYWVCQLSHAQGRSCSAAELATRQLTMKDNLGMTLTMVAAEGGMVPIIRAVLTRITAAKVS